jgi:polyisoprenoid-binding protein YceI
MLTTLMLFLLTARSAPAFGLERYEVDARASTIGFDGYSPLHDFTGKTHTITADLRADPADPGRLIGGAVWIEARTLDTDNKSRDSEMRDLLDVKDHPQIVFHLDSVQGKLVNGQGEFTALGRFTIKGVEKPRVVKFHVDPLADAPGEPAHRIHVQGETRFKMTDHGIEQPGILFAKVRDEVHVWLDLTLRPVADMGTEALVRTMQIEEEFVPRAPGGKSGNFSGTEHVWTVGSTRLWERSGAPEWCLKDEKGMAALDPCTGRTQAPTEFMKRLFDQLANDVPPGMTWTTSVDEALGRRTLRVTFAEESPARLPAWALDPHSWSNGPTPAR